MGLSLPSPSGGWWQLGTDGWELNPPLSNLGGGLAQLIQGPDVWHEKPGPPTPRDLLKVT